MTTDQIRANILELCSESEYGSWEFWLKKPKDRTIDDAENIFQVILDLIREKKIYAMEYQSVQDRSYKEVILDVKRLRDQIVSSMKPDSIDRNTSYWFLTTENGKKEDLILRLGK